ncbi:hypothetical protein [Leclercia adecarboxylata]|uniref:hypothetical protein n=1 Tax=Leclercia adecarboxylata TaxID=83655 RepID=UPI00234DF8A2|nr:hypothetical protein [Leclercia adecarboxylata]MDC6700620.1 hypothetical protein [Leclercia adecarboxylata]
MPSTADRQASSRRLRDYLRHVDHHGSESGFSTIEDDEIAELRGTANSLGLLSIASGALALSPDGHQALRDSAH